MDAGRPPESLSGRGLVLSRWRCSDLAELDAAVAANRSHLSTWLAWAADSSAGSLTTFLGETAEAWEKGERFEYGIRGEEPPGPLLGSAGLMARIGPGGLEVGYWVGKEHTRRRIASHAAA